METKIITVSIDADVVRRLRELALKEKIKKGFMGKIISRAVKEYLQEKEQNEAVDRGRALLKRGLKLGGLTYKKREELYERKISH